MGKVGRWLRSFFVTGKKAKDRADRQVDADCQSVSSAAELPTPSKREKRRWSFRRPAAKVDAGGAQQSPFAPSSSQCFSESEVRVVVVQGDRLLQSLDLKVGYFWGAVRTERHGEAAGNGAGPAGAAAGEHHAPLHAGAR
jgi:hypothetical protein